MLIQALESRGKQAENEKNSTINDLNTKHKGIQFELERKLSEQKAVLEQEWKDELLKEREKLETEFEIKQQELNVRRI
jgi:hypothetical protein